LSLFDRILRKKVAKKSSESLGVCHFAILLKMDKRSVAENEKKRRKLLPFSFPFFWTEKFIHLL
jgi:hypothetical protein